MSRILLLLEHKENRRLLSDWLATSYQLVSPDLDIGAIDQLSLLEQSCDLCILDARALDRHWRWVQAKRQAQQPVFLPFLVLTSGADVKMVTRHLWQSIDDLITKPIEKVELQARVEILLRSRQLSLELKTANEQLQNFNIELERQVQERTAQLNQQLQESQRLNLLKDDFLSTVSHELRTPMTNMKMAIQMLQVSTTQEQRDRYMQILQSECVREINLINDLLDLQRLEAGAYAIELETLQLQDWLPSVVKPFTERAIERQQTLKLDISSNIPSLLSHCSSIERVVAELLNNACKYTPPKGVIIVTARRRVAITELNGCGGVELVISNSGSEIPKSELSRIFEKFYRVPSSDPWKQGGTGLGLALVHQLVELLGGKIRAESRANLTTFTVELSKVVDSAIIQNSSKHQN